jgi:hypothetical protein
MAVEGPEWDAMKKLLKQLYDRTDTGKNCFLQIGVPLFEIIIILLCDQFFTRSCGVFLFSPCQEPFREAVDWRNLGLFDYPQVIKKPMDLGLVKRNIDAGLYSSIHDAANDVRLIWSNCLKYNEDGSEFSKIAKRLSKIFEEKFRSLLKDLKLDVQTSSIPGVSVANGSLAISPTNEERKEFAKLLFKIDKEQLGKVIMDLDEKAPTVVLKNELEDEAEIHVDLIPSDVFFDLFTYVKKCGGDKSRTKKISSKKHKAS